VKQQSYRAQPSQGVIGHPFKFPTEANSHCKLGMRLIPTVGRQNTHFSQTRWLKTPYNIFPRKPSLPNETNVKSLHTQSRPSIQSFQGNIKISSSPFTRNPIGQASTPHIFQNASLDREIMLLLFFCCQYFHMNLCCRVLSQTPKSNLRRTSVNIYKGTRGRARSSRTRFTLFAVIAIIGLFLVAAIASSVLDHGKFLEIFVPIPRFSSTKNCSFYIPETRSMMHLLSEFLDLLLDISKIASSRGYQVNKLR
jgi:hypothetical protein